MSRFLLQRVLLGVVTILGVLAFVFVAVRTSGDVVYLLLPQDATAAQVAEMRQELGLDKPLPVQFGRFVSDAAQGRLGTSTRYGASATELVLQRLPATLELAAAAFAIASLLGVLLGVAAARNRGTWIDSATGAIAVLGQAVPHFWIGIMAILVFGVKLGWLPTSGRGGLEHLLMPALTLGLFSLAAIARITRSSMLNVLGADFVTFLRSRGVPQSRVVWLHALRNALVPVVAMGGVQLSALLGNTVIVETVFNWPGLGSLVVEAVMNRDYPVVQAAVLLISAMLVVLNIVVDIVFALVDPRIRLSE